MRTSVLRLTAGLLIWSGLWAPSVLALDAQALGNAASEKLTARALATYDNADVTVQLMALPAAQLARRCDAFSLTASGSAVHGRIPLRVDCA